MQRSITLDLIFLSVLFGGLVFSSVDAIVGDFGATASSALVTERAALEADIAALEAERDRLKDHATRLAGPEIDRDLLDEMLRRQLGVGRGDDALITD